MAPVRWKEPQVIFVDSMSDFFHKTADPWRQDAWDVIRATPQHLYLILTKRSNRIIGNLPKDWGSGWENVKIGISAENQRWLESRARDLEKVTAFHKFFISVEPMLADMHLEDVLAGNHYDWVILGGESGNSPHSDPDPAKKWRYRPCSVTWLTKAVLQCKQAGVPVFVKQMGTYLGKRLKLQDRHGKDMTDPNIPESLRVQQVPDHFSLRKKQNHI